MKPNSNNSRAFDRRLIRNTAEFGAGLLTGEDLRYQRQGTGDFYGRVRHAVRGAFMAPNAGRSGKTRVLALRRVIIGELGTAHWTGQHIAAGWLAQAVAEGALDQIETNLLDEFTPDLRRIGKTLRRGFAATLRR